MAVPEVIQRELIQQFQGLGDGFDQYAFLIELAGLLPPLAREMKTPERAVRGCQSYVWLDLSIDEGLFRMDADSDTYIIKGILYLLRRMFDGQPPAAVAAAHLTIFEETEITATFGADRQKGVGRVIEDIQRFAAERAGSSGE